MNVITAIRAKAERMFAPVKSEPVQSEQPRCVVQYVNGKRATYRAARKAMTATLRQEQLTGFKVHQ